MRKYFYVALAIALVLSVSAATAAKPVFQAAQVKNPVTGEPKNTVALPARAIEAAPNIFYLGTAIDNGETVEGYAFVTPKKTFGKPLSVCGNGVCEKGENAKKCPVDCSGGATQDSSCYGFLANGAKWKAVEPYVANPANSEGLSEAFVAGNLAASVAKWETAAGKDILGNGTTTAMQLEADTLSPDGSNEVYFGEISEPNAIAITIVWGIFSGPPKNRKLVEWDQVYDQVDFDWSASGEAGKMDFESIATHELGHSVGLDDLYSSECSEQTMYGYANYGETKKRTLEAGDIAGIKKLYAG